MFDFGRRLDERLSKLNTLHFLFLFCLFLGRFGEDFGPFFLLFKFPSTFLSLPMGSAIVPEVEIHIKTRGNDTTKLIDVETNLFGENREPKMVGAKKFHMKIQSPTTQARLQSKSYRILRQAKEKSSEGDQEEE
jgi:hypothetical protein